MQKEKKELKGLGPLLKDEPEPIIGHRTKIERTTQIVNLCKKLKEIGIYEGFSAYDEFKKQGKLYIENGKYWDGRIYMKEDNGMYMNVVLSPKKTIDCSISIPKRRN